MQTDPGPAIAVDDAHALTAAEVAARLAVDPARGLDGADVARRAAAAGPNALERAEAPSIWRMVIDAATEPFVILLVASGIGAVLLNEVRDGVLILLGLVPIVGADVITEYRGERALEALRQASAPTARVRREGRVHEVAAETIVPGDLVVVRVGDVVPADLRAIRVDRLIDRSQHPHGRIAAGARRARARCAGCCPGAAPVDGILGHERRRGSRRGHRRGDRRGDRGWSDRRRPVDAHAPPIAPSARARPPRADPRRGRGRADRDHDRPRLHPGQSRRREPPRRHLRGDRRDPRGAADPPRRRPRPRRLPPPQTRRPRPAPECRGGPGRSRPGRHRQDGHAHARTGSRRPRSGTSTGRSPIPQGASTCSPTPCGRRTTRGCTRQASGPAHSPSHCSARSRQEVARPTLTRPT